MSPEAPEGARRERRARALGVATALVAMAGATLLIDWPAPAVSVSLGLVVYGLLRRRRGGAG